VHDIEVEIAPPEPVKIPGRKRKEGVKKS